MPVGCTGSVLSEPAAPLTPRLPRSLRGPSPTQNQRTALKGSLTRSFKGYTITRKQVHECRRLKGNAYLGSMAAAGEQFQKCWWSRSGEGHSAGPAKDSPLTLQPVFVCCRFGGTTATISGAVLRLCRNAHVPIRVSLPVTIGRKALSSWTSLPGPLPGPLLPRIRRPGPPADSRA